MRTVHRRNLCAPVHPLGPAAGVHALERLAHDELGVVEAGEHGPGVDKVELDGSELPGLLRVVADELGVGGRVVRLDLAEVRPDDVAIGVRLS